MSMGEILMKILGFINGVLFLLGIIGFAVWTFGNLWRGNFGSLPWLGFGGGSYTIKGKITFNDDANIRHQENVDYDPMKQPLRVAPHSKPKKPKKPKPEWWRFLTEESIGSLLEKRRRKKAEAEGRKNNPWQSHQL